MSARADGFTDYDHLAPHHQAQARDWLASFKTLHPDDAPLFAFLITKSGAVSTSRKDKRPCSRLEAAGLWRVT